MNGATEEPWPATKIEPSKNNAIAIGNNQYFFRFFKNVKYSIKSLNMKLSLCWLNYHHLEFS